MCKHENRSRGGQLGMCVLVGVVVVTKKHFGTPEPDNRKEKREWKRSRKIKRYRLSANTILKSHSPLIAFSTKIIQVKIILYPCTKTSRDISGSWSLGTSGGRRLGSNRSKYRYSTSMLSGSIISSTTATNNNRLLRMQFLFTFPKDRTIHHLVV